MGMSYSEIGDIGKPSTSSNMPWDTKELNIIRINQCRYEIPTKPKQFICPKATMMNST